MEVHVLRPIRSCRRSRDRRCQTRDPADRPRCQRYRRNYRHRPLRRGDGEEIAPFSAILLRSESAASSQIERWTASAKAIAIAELGSNAKLNAAEIVGNNTGDDRSDRSRRTGLTPAAILEMHRVLMERTHPASPANGEPNRCGSAPARTARTRRRSYHHIHERGGEAAIDDLVEFMRARTICRRSAHSALTRTPSSKRFTHSPTATDEPAERSCRACFRAQGTHDSEIYRADLCRAAHRHGTATSRHSPTTGRATSNQWSNASLKPASKPFATDDNSSPTSVRFGPAGRRTARPPLTSQRVEGAARHHASARDQLAVSPNRTRRVGPSGRLRHR